MNREEAKMAVVFPTVPRDHSTLPHDGLSTAPTAFSPRPGHEPRAPYENAKAAVPEDRGRRPGDRHVSTGRRAPRNG
ncbi:hypothetical protein Psi01_37960 [Planobispora siamensis]|uniref:Uncharacterized protein n=1 Tax=Planobispora siamensis TaxID=936338 RepID=A0A8J3WMT6_9ACTN|nr:hypothetical protein Psi01_37960 [Planobispora siamensis]